mmetsp:Transcript_6620/g.26964  ORF Transcript_6620/g.26964 Transcript_6620/m.26964 type:complete len:238 (+) Transcript_6620:2354-3067(+)
MELALRYASLPIGIGHTGVIGQREETFRPPFIVVWLARQRFRHLLAILLAEAVHDAALNLPVTMVRELIVDQRLHVLDDVLRLGLDLVHDVGAVERLEEPCALLQAQLSDAVILHALGRRRRETHERNVAESVLQDSKSLIILPEIVTPATDAVHLVNDDPRELPAVVQLLERVHELVALGNLLRREVQQLQLVVPELRVRLVLHRGSLLLHAAEHTRGDAHLAEVVQLVLDERNQR